MHALVDAAHVDHLHPDAVIALAAAADGEALTKECFGREVAWVPWRRPGFELGLQIAALAADNPGLRGVVLGGHGLTTWADTSEACQALSLDVIRRAERFLAERGAPTRWARSAPASSRCRPPSAGAWPASWRPTSGACARPTAGWWAG